jgi:hypothetical protein
MAARFFQIFYKITTVKRIGNLVYSIHLRCHHFSRMQVAASSALLPTCASQQSWRRKRPCGTAFGLAGAGVCHRSHQSILMCLRANKQYCLSAFCLYCNIF